MVYSPNRACLYGVLATNLLISWGMNVWPRAEDVVVFSETAAPLTFSIRHFSESCCSPHETYNYVLRHRRPSSLGPQNVCCPCETQNEKLRHLSLSSKSFNNDRFYKHSWSAPFLSWSIKIDFSSKTSGFISLFGVPHFCCRGLIFTIVHISKVILNVCCDDGFLEFASFP